MKHISIEIPASTIVNFREVTIEDFQIRITVFYNLILKRWMMDIENISLGTKAYSLVMNQGLDILNANWRVGLQALVLTNITSVIGLEADANNLGTEIRMRYMDMETYRNSILDGALLSREVYRVGA